MKILVTNDDGIDSPGILALVRSLKTIGDVIVVAPDRQQSAVGHALTVSSPLRVTPFHRDGEMFGYAINGTPADCIKLALTTLFSDDKPDVVVSGINHGSNTSINILYSGTVSAATEAMFMGIPSIAVSVNSFSWEDDVRYAAEVAADFARRILEMQLPTGTLLNINVPSIARENIKGIKYTGQGKARWDDGYEKRLDPMGKPYYWLSGKFIVEDDDPNSDVVAVKDGFVSVSPICYNLTDEATLANLKSVE